MSKRKCVNCRHNIRTPKRTYVEWIIRYLRLGDTMRIEYTDGTVEHYVMQYDDPHVRNTGYDVLDADGRSCFHKGYDLFIATCNDSEGRDMTATFRTLMEGDS